MSRGRGGAHTKQCQPMQITYNAAVIHSPAFQRAALTSAILFALCTAAPTQAAPRVPTSDQEVLERLPLRPGDPVQQTLRALRDRSARAPGEAAPAAELAQAYYRLAQREGDPRYVGYAQTAIAPWQRQPEPPTDILLVRAQLAQFLHDFAAAEADLGRILQRTPKHLAALSYRAILHLVQAHYDAARADCQVLAMADRGLVIDACLPAIQSVTGEAGAAYRALTAALARYPAAPDNERLWVHTRLAETAQRLGHFDDAEQHFRAALAIGIRDQYLLATYAEFLLDRGRAADAAALLQDETRNDVLLLRRALAEKALGTPVAAELARIIETRISAARLRKDELHLADEARFALDIQGNPRLATQLARRNWDSGQREPSDARLLLEAALKARDRAAAGPALDWLRTSRHEDPLLQRVAAQLQALP